MDRNRSKTEQGCMVWRAATFQTRQAAMLSRMKPVMMAQATKSHLDHEYGGNAWPVDVNELISMYQWHSMATPPIIRGTIIPAAWLVCDQHPGIAKRNSTSSTSPETKLEQLLTPEVVIDGG